MHLYKTEKLRYEDLPLQLHKTFSFGSVSLAPRFTDDKEGEGNWSPFPWPWVFLFLSCLLLLLILCAFLLKITRAGGWDVSLQCSVMVRFLGWIMVSVLSLFSLSHARGPAMPSLCHLIHGPMARESFSVYGNLAKGACLSKRFPYKNGR